MSGLTDPGAKALKDFLGLGELPAPPGLLTAGSRLGRYVIEELLGRGGMGVVYRARDTELGRDVALKVLSAAGPGLDERFAREGRAAARLQHPNLVRVYDVGEASGVRYLAMEHVDGPPLDAVPAPESPAELRARVVLLEKTARALDHAHREGVVHRDVKPANILVDRDGEPRLADFGLARVADEERGLTRSRTAIGTPAYMAPEQVKGDLAAVGPRSDVYSLGVILYESLAGRTPFRGATAVEIFDRILREEPVPPRRLEPSAPADLETVCLKAMARDPRDRYASAGEFADELARHLVGEPVLARRMPTVLRAWWGLRRRPAAALVAAALVLAVAAGTWGVGAWRAAADAEVRRRAEEQRRLPPDRRPRDSADRHAAAHEAWSRYRRAAGESGAGPGPLARRAAEAVAAAELAVSTDERPEGRALLGAARRAAGDAAGALREWDRALELDPACFVALAGRARAGLEDYFAGAGQRFSVAGKSEEGLPTESPEQEASRVRWTRDLRAARAAPRADADALALLEALELLALGRAKEAGEGFDRYLAAYPGDAEAAYFAGQARLWAGEPAAGLERLDAALRVRRPAPWVSARAIALVRLGRATDALAAFDEAVELEPREWSYRQNRGAVRMALGRLDDARADFDEAVRLAPGVAMVRSMRASVLRQQGRLEEALVDADAAVKADPADGMFRVNRGNILLQMNRLPEAMQDYTAGVERRIPLAHVGRGHVHQLQGRTAEAVADFDAAIRLDDSCREGYAARGKLALKLADAAGPGEARRALARKAASDLERVVALPGVAAALEKARRLADEN